MKSYEMQNKKGYDNDVFEWGQDDSYGGKKEKPLEEEKSQARKKSLEIKNSLKAQKDSDKKDAADPEDPWAMLDTGKPWKTMTTKEKASRVALNTTKILSVFTLLYFFICSLDLLSSSFKLISGQATSELVDNELLTNPIVGLMVGVLLTVLVQSSSTSTSIIVSMVSAGILSVHVAIPIIMGSNVGTSVTNTIVSLTQAGDREQFRRAFAGATVHDMFNWLTVIVMLTLEICFGLLEKLTAAIVEPIAESSSGAEVKILKVITEPFTDIIIQLDTTIMNCWSLGEWLDKTSIIKEFCDYYYFDNVTTVVTETTMTTEMTMTTDINDTASTQFCVEDTTRVGIEGSCKFLFYETSMTDSQVGIILLVMSLVILCGALIIIVKLLNSMLKGSIAIVIKKTLNADIPYVPWLTGYIALLIGAVLTFIVQSSSIFTSTLTPLIGSIAIVIKKTLNADIPYVPWLTGYIALLIGAVLTFIVQSSSIFTSTLTPLIGIGIITVERAYPLTLGSNIGTTTTALLASLAGEGEGLYNAVQIALVHLFFNVFGILIFYPIPFMRFPLPLCKKLGNITAMYRWFAIVYLIGMFFLMPGFVFLLSLGGSVVLWSVIGPIIILCVIIGIINFIQNKRPSLLPEFLRDWEFMPLPLRSLEPYDKAATSLPCCKSCRNEATEEKNEQSRRSSTSSANSSHNNETSNPDNDPS
ncbi:Sodium-dependent phosphate transport protein [Trinorchestia longiramus]|nr:Sodium-dependent phosphate transport protein [Trinorchestia longiramus]